MVKKKKKKFQQFRQNKKLKNSSSQKIKNKNKPILHKKQAPKEASSVKPEVKSLIIANEIPLDRTTTFSKKLEEVIEQNQSLTKRGLLGVRKIILLNAPIGYSKEEWKKYLARFWSITLKFLIGILVIGLVVSAVVAVEIISNQKTLPGITLAGKNIGSLSYPEIKQTVSQLLSDKEASKIQFNYQGKQISLPISQLAVTYDLDNTINSLPLFSFDKNNFIALLKAEIYPQNFPLLYKIDPQKTVSILENEFGIDLLRAKNARFYFDDKKKLSIRPEENGIKIDQTSLIQQLSPLFSGNTIAAVELPTIQEIPNVKASDLSKYQTDLQVKIENTISLNYGKNKWKFDPKNHLEDIIFEKSQDQVIIKIAPELLDNFFKKEVFASIEYPSSDLKISFDQATQKAVFDGKSKNGLQINRQQFVSDLESALNSLDKDIDIPVTTIVSKIETDQAIQNLGIKEVISTGHTAFAGSPVNRRHNIVTGMSKFNGAIIKPGETFSFNNILGAVDGSTGYKLELVIKAEGTVPEYGGGVCQVSSTMFKAALLAGFPIVERAPHSYAVGYYAQIDGYGLDSTIYPGVRDLKFINDSGNNVLIQTFVDGDDAYINFFGTSDGRQVKLENYWRGNFRGAGGTELIPTTTLPTGAKKQIESAHGGFDASWDRVIYRDGKETTRDKIYSVYRATSNRILVGQ